MSNRVLDPFTGREFDAITDRHLFETFEPNGYECDVCGTGLVDRCNLCGAPVCCPKCCEEARRDNG